MPWILRTEKAAGIITFCWCYAILWSIFPFLGWGAFIPEGILDSCGFDYLTRDIRVNFLYKNREHNHL